MNDLDVTIYHIYLTTVLTYDFIFISINYNCRAKYGFTYHRPNKNIISRLVGGFYKSSSILYKHTSGSFKD